MLKLFQIIIGCLFTSMVTSAFSGDYPERPIELVIPFEVGSAIDISGRLLSDLMEEDLGVKIVINNKSGGSGASAYTYIKNSKADGYTIGMFNSALVSHKVFGNLPFDYHDLEVVMLIQTTPSVLCVPMNSKYQTLKDAIDDAKERPGQVTWATGSGNALNGSRDFWHHAEVEFKFVPFGGSVQPIMQTSGGHFDMCFVNIIQAKPLLEAGLVRALATYGKERIRFLSDVPTFEELGYPVRCSVIRGFIAPLGIPQDRLNLLHAAVKKAVLDDTYIEFIRNASGTPLSISSADAVQALDEQRKAFIDVAIQEKITP